MEGRLNRQPTGSAVGNVAMMQRARGISRRTLCAANHDALSLPPLVLLRPRLPGDAAEAGSARRGSRACSTRLACVRKSQAEGQLGQQGGDAG
eukprot:6892253-Prymnesium_polylepis.1